MYTPDINKIWLGTGEERVYLEPAMANRHGIISGATGTGKTVTLKVIAESFSDMGVPVFITDIKGDISGMCEPGRANKHILRSIETMGIRDFSYTSYPVRFFDVFGKLGHPVRTTVSEMGPELLARLLGLNETQTGVLRIVFRIADDRGLLLIDLKDLRAMLQYTAENAAEFRIRYGSVSAQSVGAVQRALLGLQDAGGDLFFGEPALEIADWFDWDADGRGVMNILSCSELFEQPLLYGTFLLWMLTELYELLPEAGDLEKPKIAFFFDEAHLLFQDTPRTLLQKIEQVVRLIRSKGVSVWFITQKTSDVPQTVLAQIGNRIQHALRAYTPNEQKDLHASARSFRVNPAFDTEQVLQELATGEAVVSVLDEKGVPGIAQRVFILPPRSSMNAVETARITDAVKTSPLYRKYAASIDRESAFELLEAERVEKAEAEAAAIREKEEQAEEKRKSSAGKTAQAKKKQVTSGRQTGGKKKTSALEKAAASALNSMGREVGRQLVRGLLGTLKK